MKNMENRTKINDLLEEAQANFTLYQNTGDGKALERYNILMDIVEKNTSN